MTAMTPRSPTRKRSRTVRAALTAAAVLAVLAAAGCSTGHPGEIAAGSLAEAQTFPYFPVYWAGRSFEGRPVAAVDGLRSYIPSVGDSVYYGDCVQAKGIFGTGTCKLPLQVTTVIFHVHTNGALGTQQNVVLRGVPAVIYEEGRSVELYSGQVAIDVYSDTAAHALAAVRLLRPANAPGSALSPLPLPIYCPGLSGAVTAEVAKVMANLPGKACQVSAARKAFAESLKH